MVKICPIYYDHYLKSYNNIWALIANYIGFIIIGVNAACRNLFILLAKYIGYTSVTLETEFIKYGVFVVYFINTSILYIVAPWDSRENKNRFLNTIF